MTEEQKPMPALRASLGKSSVGTGMLASSVLYVANLHEQDLVQNNKSNVQFRFKTSVDFVPTV